MSASIESEDDKMNRWPRILIVVTLVASTIGCDRLSKRVALRELAGGPRRSFLGDTLRLDCVENRGAFLSMGARLPDRARTPLLAGATIVGLIALSVVLVRRRCAGGWDTVGLSLVWAGGASNLVDRLSRGQVVDFLNIGVGSLRTGIFNMADVAITCGVLLILLGRRGADSSRRPDGE
jgi:signal peptidase II